MRYKQLQKMFMRTTFNVAQGIYFLKDGERCHNTLQQVTMRYKMLQKQCSPRTSLKISQKFF